MISKKTTISKEALELASELFPNSILGDLLINFPTDFAVKFITIFSGRFIYMPKVETIYRLYRNKTIKDKLENNDVVEVRQYLSNFFGITMKRVSEIYHQEKKRKRKGRKIDAKSIKRISDAVFRDEIRKVSDDVSDFARKRK